MFIQVIQGTVSDEASLRRYMDRWTREVQPGTTGYLGTTAGRCDDGTFLALVRFESAEAARQNSERLEQRRWWAATEKCFDGEVSVSDCPDATQSLDVSSDDPGPDDARPRTGLNAPVGSRTKERGLIEKIKEVWQDINYAQRRLIELNYPGSSKTQPGTS
jgi:hypothetical protein